METKFFYLGSGRIVGVDIIDGIITSEWGIHMNYEMEMAGRSCVSEGEDGHSDMIKAVRYEHRPAEWVGRPESDLESRAKLERELEEQVWCVVYDNETQSLEAVLAPRWSAKSFQKTEYASEVDAKAAIARGEYDAHLAWALNMLKGIDL